MRDPKRIKPILNQLEQIWTSLPDLRLTQLIINLQTKLGKDLYYMEDEELMKKLRQLYFKDQE